jgi:hypothetical protein
MFVMADEFNIPPWEYNEDGERYKDDITSIIALKYIQQAAQKHEQEKAMLKSTLDKK